MESLRQNNGFTQTVTKQVDGKTLVIGRPFQAQSSMLGDSNQDRRESGISLNRKRPSQQTQHSSGIVPLNKPSTSSSSRPKPRPRHREASTPPPAEDLLAKWKKQSQLEDSSDDDDARLLGLSGTTKARNRAGKVSSSMAKSATSGIKKIRLTLCSPETTTSGLPSTSRTASQPSKDSDDDDDSQWYEFSQDHKPIPSSAPRKDLRLEVSIGRGDGESIASASSEVFARDAPVPASGATKSKRPRSVSLGYDNSSEDERQRRRFESGGRSRERVEESDDEVVVVEKGKGKGKAKAKKVEEREKVPVKSKKTDGKGKARQEEPSKSSKSTGKSKPSVTKTDLLKPGSGKRANDNSGKRKDMPSPAKKASVPHKQSATSKKKPQIRMGSSEDDPIDSDVSSTPRPKKKSRDIAKSGKASAKSSARREPTPPPATKSAGTKRKRTYEDDPTDFFSGYETSSRTTARKKQAVVAPRTPEKRGTESKSKRGKEKEKVVPRTKEKTTRDKSAAKTKEKAAASTKEKPTRIGSPTGFPSPMRAPVRVNEALLSSQLETEPEVEQPRQRFRQNSYGEQEEIAYGPNGVELLPILDMIPADRPTIQLAAEKILQLIARKITDEKCPFCKEFLPVQMSESTEATFDKLRSSRHAEAAQNDWTRTIEFCERHRAESHIFPLGIHSGYPAEMNFTELRQRVKKMKPEIKRILKTPKNSAFYVIVCRDLEKHGRRRWSSNEARNDEQRKNRLLPGYFGPLGKMTLTTVLRGILRSDRFAQLVTPQAIDPLTVDEYIEHVLVLEVAVRLISEDMLQSRGEDEEPYTEKEKRARALQILKESREYGRLRFGMGSEYLAAEDQGNGATQMVIADVRGFDDDSEDETDNDGESSSEAEEQEQAPSARQRSPLESSARSEDEAAVRDQLESSPPQVEDDEIRPASREILALASSPESAGRGRTRSPADAIIVDSPEPRRASASQVDTRMNPVSVIDDEEDDFDVPGMSLDAQELIDAANGVEESHYQQEKRSKTAQVNGRARPPPKFAAEVVNIVSPGRTRSTTGNVGNERGERSAMLNSRKSVPDIVHVVDDDNDDPLAANLGNHRNLAARTQVRQTPHNARPGSSTWDRGMNSGGANGATRYGGTQGQSQNLGNRRNDMATSNANPYNFQNTPPGGRRVGLSRNTGARTGASGDNGRPGKAAAPLFHTRKTNQALANRQQTAQIYDAMAGR